MGKGKLRSDRIKSAFGDYAYQGLVDGIVSEARSFIDEGMSSEQVERKLCETHPEDLVSQALRSSGLLGA